LFTVPSTKFDAAFFAGAFNIITAEDPKDSQIRFVRSLPVDSLIPSIVRPPSIHHHLLSQKFPLSPFMGKERKFVSSLSLSERERESTRARENTNPSVDRSTALRCHTNESKEKERIRLHPPPPPAVPTMQSVSRDD